MKCNFATIIIIFHSLLDGFLQSVLKFCILLQTGKFKFDPVGSDNFLVHLFTRTAANRNCTNLYSYIMFGEQELLQIHQFDFHLVLFISISFIKL